MVLIPLFCYGSQSAVDVAAGAAAGQVTARATHSTFGEAVGSLPTRPEHLPLKIDEFPPGRSALRIGTTELFWSLLTSEIRRMGVGESIPLHWVQAVEAVEWAGFSLLWELSSSLTQPGRTLGVLEVLCRISSSHECRVTVRGAEHKFLFLVTERIRAALEVWDLGSSDQDEASLLDAARTIASADRRRAARAAMRFMERERAAYSLRYGNSLPPSDHVAGALVELADSELDRLRFMSSAAFLPILDRLVAEKATSSAR